MGKKKSTWKCPRCACENTTKTKCSSCQCLKPSSASLKKTTTPILSAPSSDVASPTNITSIATTTTPVTATFTPTPSSSSFSTSKDDSLASQSSTRKSARAKKIQKHKYASESEKESEDEEDEPEGDDDDDAEESWDESNKVKKKRKVSAKKASANKTSTRTVASTKKRKMEKEETALKKQPKIKPVKPLTQKQLQKAFLEANRAQKTDTKTSANNSLEKNSATVSSGLASSPSSYSFSSPPLPPSASSSSSPSAYSYSSSPSSSSLPFPSSSTYSCPDISAYSAFTPTPKNFSSSSSSSLKRAHSGNVVFEKGRFGGGAVMNERQKSSNSNRDEDEDDNKGEEEEEDDEILAEIRVKVKGLQYYKGIISKGETAFLQREPLNIYDKNAIKVLSVLGAQVGHVEKDVASLLSPLFDEKKITSVEATITTPPGSFSCSMDLCIWGEKKNKELVSSRLQFCTRAKSGSISSSSYSNKNINSSGINSISSKSPYVSQQTMTQSVSYACDMLMKDLHNTDILDVLDPPSCCLSSLYRHQKQALFWMCESERVRVDDIFWEKDRTSKNTFRCRVTESRVNEQPLCMRGGILADDMGLGKTLTVLCLVARNKFLSSSSSSSSSSSRRSSFSPSFLSGPTLIVCPLSVLSNWTLQAQTHFTKGSLTVSLYHGSQRDGKECEGSDIVLTTYETITSEYDGSSSSSSSSSSGKTPKQQTSWPFKQKWARIILDEGQKICNRTSQRFYAVCALEARSRFVLSGTPIMNKIEDFFALVSFLRLHPFDNYNLFRRFVSRPIKQHLVVGFSLLQKLVKSCTLRRTKTQIDTKTGKPLISLPSKIYHILTITLSSSEQQAYECVKERAKQLFRQMEAKGEMMPKYSNVLEALLRLRQCCCDLSLLGLEGLSSQTALSPEIIKRLSTLVDQLDKKIEGKNDASSDNSISNEEMVEECCICFSLLTQPMLTKCGHMFCEMCMSTLLRATDSAPCPLCRSLLRKSELMSYSTAKSIVRPSSSSRRQLQPSSKQQVLLNKLKADPNEKALVISQWTQFLDNTYHILEADNIKCVRLDGRSTRVQRDRAIEEFMSTSTPFAEQPQVMLLSLKAGGLGLNLVAATRVYILDPWWNVASEEQAIDRVYRLGQTKQVEVFRLVADGTLEPRILDLQQRKSDLMQGAFASKSAGELAKQRLSDLKLLLDF